MYQILHDMETTKDVLVDALQPYGNTILGKLKHKWLIYGISNMYKIKFLILWTSYADAATSLYFKLISTSLHKLPKLQLVELNCT